MPCASNCTPTSKISFDPAGTYKEGKPPEQSQITQKRKLFSLTME